MRSVTLNDEISFTVEGSREQFKGAVYAIEPSIDLATRSLTVRALCPNKENKILPGAFAHIILPLKEIKDAVMIPTQAVIPELKGQKVYICKNGVVTARAIEAGIRNDSTIQVTSGLEAGDSVLLTGLLALRPQQADKITLVK